MRTVSALWWWGRARGRAAEDEWKTHVRRRYIGTHFSSLFFSYFFVQKRDHDEWHLVVSSALFSHLFHFIFFFVCCFSVRIYIRCWVFCFLHKFNLLFFFHKHVSFFVHGYKIRKRHSKVQMSAIVWGLHFKLSMFLSQLNSVPPFLTTKLPKLLNRNSKSLSLALSFSNLNWKRRKRRKTLSDYLLMTGWKIRNWFN